MKINQEDVLRIQIKCLSSNTRDDYLIKQLVYWPNVFRIDVIEQSEATHFY